MSIETNETETRFVVYTNCDGDMAGEMCGYTLEQAKAIAQSYYEENKRNGVSDPTVQVLGFKFRNYVWSASDPIQ